MPQIDVKSMYMGCYLLASKSEKIYNDQIIITSMKEYQCEEDAEEDLAKGILRYGEKFKLCGDVISFASEIGM